MPVQAMPPANDERERQSRVLKGLRERAQEKAVNPREWMLTPVAGKLGVSASQLARYESGDTILPTTYYAAFSDLYGVSRVAFARLLGLLDDQDDDPSWSLEAALREAGVSDALFKRALDMAWGEPVALQKRVAEAIISIDRDMRGVSDQYAQTDAYREQQRTTA